MCHDILLELIEGIKVTEDQHSRKDLVEQETGEQKSFEMNEKESESEIVIIGDSKDVKNKSNRSNITRYNRKCRMRKSNISRRMKKFEKTLNMLENRTEIKDHKLEELNEKIETNEDLLYKVFENVNENENEVNQLKMEVKGVVHRDCMRRIECLENNIKKETSYNEDKHRFKDLKFEEDAKKFENIEEHVKGVFESLNENEKELDDLRNKVDLIEKTQKNGDVHIASFGKLFNDFKQIVKSILNLFGEKSKDNDNEMMELRRTLNETLTRVSKLVLGVDKDVCSKINEMTRKIEDLSRESKEYEKIFYNNFASLTHEPSKKDVSPGNILHSKEVKSQIKLKFRKETISLPYTSNEICARILTVDGLSQGFINGLKNTLNPHNGLKKMMSKEEEKVVLLVGVTGAGKSTLIDAITNFYYNVRFDDPFRLALIDLLDAEKKKKGNQATSQTDEITVYKLPFLENGNAKGFKLTIIDTPGVADTRGISQDKKIIEKLRYLFEDGRISFLNSVCFVSNAGNSRLTAGQKYIFDSLITNFGIDLVNNIVGLFTFDDGGPAKATDAFREAKIGLTAHFKFNSQAMINLRTNQTPVNKTIMMTMEAQDCVQFQHFYNNCDDFFAILSRYIIFKYSNLIPADLRIFSILIGCLE